MATAPAPKSRLDALTSMRFVAAIMVVVFHLSNQAPFMTGAPRVLQNVIDGGYVWVGFFFVLSGFILSYQYLDRVRDGTFDARDFFLARLARIYPGHLLGFVIMAALLSIKRIDVLSPEGGPTVVAFVVIATLGLAHAWAPSFALTFNFPSWSISTEFFFYLCFPIVAVAAVRLSLRHFLWITAAVLSASVIGNLAYCAHDPFGWIGNDWAHDLDRSFIKFFPLVRLPEFVLGVAMGRLYAARGEVGLTASTGQQLTVAGTFMIFVGLACSSWVPFVLMHNVALSLPFAALTLGLALAPASTLGRWLSGSTFLALGEASYSVYILQAPVIWVLYLRDEWTADPSLPFAVGIRVAAVGAIVGFAIVSHRFLETPTREWIRGLGRRTQTGALH